MGAARTPRAVFASHNAHKRDEVWAILAPLLPGWTELDLASARDFDVPPPVEDGVTFAENALVKARAVCAATGLPAVADDSGLAVDVMGGAPGIFSALWSGAHGADEREPATSPRAARSTFPRRIAARPSCVRPRSSRRGA